MAEKISFPKLNYLQETVGPIGLAFPKNLKNQKDDSPFVHFRIVPAYSPVRNSKLNIALFMPNSMRISYNSNWEEVDLGFITNAAANALTGSYQDMAAINGTLLEGLTQAGTDAISEYSNLNANAIYQITLRKAINPHAALLFKNMAFREFKLDWLLFPKSEADTTAIKDIIFQFKYAMHPGESVETGTYTVTSLSNYYGLPENFIISFYAPALHALVKTHPCALIACDVEYNAAGVPVYFKNDRPACISLSLHFKECAILTKTDIRQGW